MSQRGKIFAAFFTILLLTFFWVQTSFAYSGTALKFGMSGDSVSRLQRDLKTLGYMSTDPTGYFGDITKTAVTKFQAKYGLAADGVAGAQTFGKIDALLGKAATATVSRGESTQAQKIIDFAKKFMGVKYVWGGTTPKGFDCSGFVKYIYNNFGIALSRVSSEQAKNGTYVKKENLRPGDLVFFDTNGGSNGINHVGIYIGGGKFIQASSGQSGVVVSSVAEGFYAKAYMTARRVL